MEHSPSWEANGHSASQEISHFSWNQNIYYHKIWNCQGSEHVYVGLQGLSTENGISIPFRSVGIHL
jgi:hypothetical protein